MRPGGVGEYPGKVGPMGAAKPSDLPRVTEQVLRAVQWPLPSASVALNSPASSPRQVSRGPQQSSMARSRSPQRSLPCCASSPFPALVQKVTPWGH